ncbi:MAG: hypothetical protein EBS86_16365, partial [Crocinitomicaceae bacterium]|nr:hypothetical protein [Crocinitomicaceae bacterium]
FETEEIIISTDTFSFDEYIIARKYHLIINLFLNELRFEKLLNLFDVLDIPRWEWIQKMYELIETSNYFKVVISQFIEDTKGELFSNLSDLELFYSLKENYSKLELGLIGDNVVHKYRVLSNYFNWDKVCEFAYQAASILIENSPSSISKELEFQIFWKNLFTYHYHSYANGKNKVEIINSTKVELEFDIKSWINDGMNQKILKYKLSNPQTFHFYLPEMYKKNLMASLSRWNTDLVGMSLMIRKIKQHWLEKECELEEKTLTNQNIN